MPLVISKKHKYIFFHLPKNAGVSVSRMLIDQEKLLQIRRIASFFFRKIRNPTFLFNDRLFYYCILHCD